MPGKSSASRYLDLPVNVNNWWSPLHNMQSKSIAFHKPGHINNGQFTDTRALNATRFAALNITRFAIPLGHFGAE